MYGTCGLDLLIGRKVKYYVHSGYKEATVVAAVVNERGSVYVFSEREDGSVLCQFLTDVQFVKEGS